MSSAVVDMGGREGPNVINLRNPPYVNPSRGILEDLRMVLDFDVEEGRAVKIGPDQYDAPYRVREIESTNRGLEAQNRSGGFGSYRGGWGGTKQRKLFWRRTCSAG